MDRGALDREELEAVRATARRFARREVAPLVGVEGRDGDLDALPALLARAGAAGLLAASDPASPGHEHGVWGAACRERPASELASLIVLEELAAACAGVAACVHVAGLGALERGPLEGAAAAAERGGAAVALLSEAWRPGWSALERPPAGAARIEGDRLSGSLAFVHAAPGCEGFVVHVAAGDRWERVLIRGGDPGLVVQEAGPRTGLAAVRVVHLTLDEVPLAAAARLGPADPPAHLRRLLLGLAAIALGNARGALDAARQYAGERHQGGARIERHGAVRLLLGDSAARIAAAAGCLEAAAWAGVGAGEGARTAAPTGGAREPLWAALAAKLRVTLTCGQAVTDCLQVLGGYGYMEDYRLEKRLRDALTLQSLAIAPDQARLLCAADPREGADGADGADGETR